jgi:RNA polymerase sigma factor (sigma-70 family)
MLNGHTHEPTVFVVDDDASVRESLRWMVGSLDLPVETYATAREFLGAQNGGRPGCLVLDLRMPEMSGLDLQNELAARHIRLPIIMISGHADVASAVRALKAGAIDFLEKPFARNELLARVQEALAMDAKAREAETERLRVDGCVARLTPRERQVMDLVVSGKTNKSIAAELGLCEKTVEVHRARVMAKMEADSLAHLVKLVAVERGA